jgi:hypothetical protein
VKKSIVLMLAWLLAGCNFPSLETISVVDPSQEEYPSDQEPGHSATFSPVLMANETTIPAVTPSSGQEPCAWNWNTYPLPGLTDEIQKALETDGFDGVKVQVVEFGEDCIDFGTNTVRYFATKQTDFKITVPVDDLQDREALVERLTRVLDVLMAFPPDDTPGPMSGQISIFLVVNGDQVILRFDHDAGIAARQEGLEGEALLEALGYQP